MAAPRRWGYSRCQGTPQRPRNGCPTQVGIFRWYSTPYRGRRRLPHAGGDIPLPKFQTLAIPLAAPRRWGYSCTCDGSIPGWAGCPTQVGIFLDLEDAEEIDEGLPHAGGDIPHGHAIQSSLRLAAPRRWGYSPVCLLIRRGGDGCPTQVGIFLRADRHLALSIWLPHAGGDIPSSARQSVSIP